MSDRAPHVPHGLRDRHGYYGPHGRVDGCAHRGYDLNGFYVDDRGHDALSGDHGHDSYEMNFRDLYGCVA